MNARLPLPKSKSEFEIFRKSFATIIHPNEFMAFAGQEHIFVDMIDESKSGTVFESKGV